TAAESYRSSPSGRPTQFARPAGAPFRDSSATAAFGRTPASSNASRTAVPPVPCRYLAVSVLEVVFLRQASIARMLQADATDLARFITALSQDMTVQASTAQVVTKFFAFLGRGPNPPGLDRCPIEAAATV